jgi:ribosome maturation factor RimP
MVPFFVFRVGAPSKEMRDALMRLLEPPIEALGFELVDIEFARRRARRRLRIFIDRGGGEPDAGG